MNGPAIEHILWAVGEDFCPEQVLESIGITPPNRPATWEDCHIALSIKHRQILAELQARSADNGQMVLLFRSPSADKLFGRAIG